MDALRSGMTLHDMQESVLQSVEAPDASTLELLDHSSTIFENPNEITHWLRIMATNRQYFYGTIMYQTRDENGQIPNRVYMPLIVFQRPYTVVWLVLELVSLIWNTDLGCRHGATPGKTDRSPTFSFEKLEFASDITI